MPTKHRAYILRVDGTEQELDHRPTYDEAVKIVGGYIEFVKGKKDSKTLTMVVDEEGRLKGYHKNSKATLLYWARCPYCADVIMGDVLVLEGWRTVGGP